MNRLKQIRSKAFCLVLMFSAFGVGAQDGAAVDTAMRSGPFVVYSALPPGGPVDTLARLLSDGLQKKYGQASVVENLPGAGGNIALERLRRSKADGHALLLVPAGSLTINPTLMPNFPFVIERDFTLVTMLAKAPNILVTNPETGIKNLNQLIAKAKANPGKLTYATPGVGSGLHLAGELFKAKALIDIAHVPYKGSAPALADLIGGHVPFMLTNVPAVLPYLRNAKLIPLGVTEASRTPLAPAVPTFAEQGIPGVVVTSWYGLVAPAGTPPAVAARLASDAKALLEVPAVREQMSALGMVVATTELAVFSEYVRNESKVWRETIKSSHISID